MMKFHLSCNSGEELLSLTNEEFSDEISATFPGLAKQKAALPMSYILIGTTKKRVISLSSIDKVQK